MAKLLVGIAAHPLREQYVQSLLKGPLWGLDGSQVPLRPGAGVEKPTVAVTYDRFDNEWDTHERAWSNTLGLAGLSRNRDTTHVLVLQDDAVPCQDLVSGLEGVLDQVSCPVSLYFGNALGHPKIARAAQQANELGASWIVSPGVWWGVAVVLPVDLVEDMLMFCSGRRELYDRRLTIWCEYNQLPVLYPWPSLVDHRDDPSLVNPGRRPGRKAINFAGEDFSASHFDPTGPMVACGRVADLSSIKLAPKEGGSAWPPTPQKR